MKLYFDTNIFDFISATGEAQEAQKWLVNNGHFVEASSTNVIEIYQIPNDALRNYQLAVLVDVASSFEERPQSWWHAQEVISEIRRCFPQWLRMQPDKHLKTLEKIHLENHKNSWEAAKKLISPIGTKSYEEYKNLFQQGVDQGRASQKIIKTLNNKKKQKVRSHPSGNQANEIVTPNIFDPNMYWRGNCYDTWLQAFEMRYKPARDYYDWLAPYVIQGAFRQQRFYYNFWAHLVEDRNVPKNKLVSLVGYYQNLKKYSHGNFNDQNHASKILDVDAFLTADKAFFDIMNTIVAIHFPSQTKVYLVNREKDSALAEIERNLS